MVVSRDVLTGMFEKLRGELNLESELDEKIRLLCREVIRYSKLSILNRHRGETEKAYTNLREAESRLNTLRSLVLSRPEVIGMESYRMACQEYVEAYLYLCCTDGIIPKLPEELNVSPSTYILGLADLVGELRRGVLEYLRRGDFVNAEEYSRIMKWIYEELLLIEGPPALSGRLRHKIDVARRMVETTESELFFESGKKKLIEALSKLTG
ncbi:MAG: hypothetical protein RMJ00_03540 [Nitrososphaerota archaeon]|nr:hypothetical protein [Candidatus Bathyarchaeota archaeon]MDW8061752.1 hypothetical protein [Nitrososphaerota archaeon]